MKHPNKLVKDMIGKNNDYKDTEAFLRKHGLPERTGFPLSELKKYAKKFNMPEDYMADKLSTDGYYIDPTK